ncbi:hypothetical protein T492DRAFT_843675 [Pavlovales sp. CCMP2436]|nr:hypothetical protein T492DRAFT_843675 [Pavlovales sp. CCMP2436]
MLPSLPSLPSSFPADNEIRNALAHCKELVKKLISSEVDQKPPSTNPRAHGDKYGIRGDHTGGGYSGSEYSLFSNSELIKIQTASDSLDEPSGTKVSALRTSALTPMALPLPAGHDQLKLKNNDVFEGFDGKNPYFLQMDKESPGGEIEFVPIRLRPLPAAPVNFKQPLVIAAASIGDSNSLVSITRLWCDEPGMRLVWLKRLIPHTGGKPRAATGAAGSASVTTQPHVAPHTPPPMIMVGGAMVPHTMVGASFPVQLAQRAVAVELGAASVQLAQAMRVIKVLETSATVYTSRARCT